MQPGAGEHESLGCAWWRVRRRNLPCVYRCRPEMTHMQKGLSNPNNKNALRQTQAACLRAGARTAREATGPCGRPLEGLHCYSSSSISTSGCFLPGLMVMVTLALRITFLWIP